MWDAALCRWETRVAGKPSVLKRGAPGRSRARRGGDGLVLGGPDVPQAPKVDREFRISQGDEDREEKRASDYEKGGG